MKAGAINEGKNSLPRIRFLVAAGRLARYCGRDQLLHGVVAQEGGKERPRGRQAGRMAGHRRRYALRHQAGVQHRRQLAGQTDNEPC